MEFFSQHGIDHVNMEHLFLMIRSLCGESILMQLRLVPRMSDVHNQAPVVPEPVVNWEAAILTAFRVGSGQRRRYLRYSALAAMRTGVCVALGV